MKCLFNADMADNSVALFSIISILLASLGNVQADLDGSEISSLLARDPDERVATLTLIKNKGYPIESHEVTTEDGYILTLHRIPNPNKPVVFLQHGLMDGSYTFVFNFANQSLGYFLYDAGYDVWMGNIRGSTYGSKHVKLNPKDEAFWDFTFSEMGKYDLPAMVDYALKYTSQKDLIYIGHSQGTMIAFSQLGTNSYLASRIKLFIALAPVAHLGNVMSPVKLLADFGAPTNQMILFNIFGKRDFLPTPKLVKWLTAAACNDPNVDKYICSTFLYAMAGPTKYMNESRVAVYFSLYPDVTSTKNIVHFMQLITTGKFQMYDYGSPLENLAHYKQFQPPLYDVSKVRTPVALYWADNDWLADPVDVKFLRNTLPNIVDDYDTSDWNHYDFVWATNTKEYLYDRMLQLMKKY